MKDIDIYFIANKALDIKNKEGWTPYKVLYKFYWVWFTIIAYLFCEGLDFWYEILNKS